MAPGSCQDSPFAYDLADVAGPLQQLGQEELGVRDATHDLLRRIGWKSTTACEPLTHTEVLPKTMDLKTGPSVSMGKALVRSWHCCTVLLGSSKHFLKVSTVLGGDRPAEGLGLSGRPHAPALAAGVPGGLRNMSSDTTRAPLTPGSPVLSILCFSKGAPC